MPGFLAAPLMATLGPHFSLSRTRLETFAVLPAGLANCRTVNLSHPSSRFPGEALPASSHRRLQRFFQYVRLDEDVAARLIARLPDLSGPKLPALDRTNWKPGKADINILVLAVAARRFKAPLMWLLPGHRGNSMTSQRKGPVQRYLRLFGASSIEALPADREFIGDEWMACLVENNVPFAVRLREDMHIDTEDGRRFQLRSLLRKPRSGKWTGRLPGMDRRPENALRFEGRKLRNGGLLLVAANMPAPENALRPYRKGWGIELPFRRCENTGIQHRGHPHHQPRETGNFACGRCIGHGVGVPMRKPCNGPKGHSEKSRKRRGKSWFRLGFGALRRWLLHDPEKAMEAWRRTCPKRPAPQQIPGRISL